MTPRMIVEKTETIWIVKFNNPPHGYMDDPMVDAFVDFLDNAEKDEALRVVILTGNEPDVFIRHFDVGVLLANSQKMAKRGLTFSADRPVPEAAIHACYRRIEEMSVVFIAAINGSAMGGGFEMVLACDFRLVKQGPYDLGLPEINIGILPGAGGTQRLPRLIGQAKALEMELLGRTLSPDEAVSYGIAMECIDGDVVARAREIAKKLSEKSARASAHIKKLIRGSSEWELEDGLAKERTLFCDLMVDERGLADMARMVNGDNDIRDPEQSADSRIAKPENKN
ncbi:MAG: enoyl-CoA hydratase/isomerase family protein [Sneathiella sp.]